MHQVGQDTYVVEKKTSPELTCLVVSPAGQQNAAREQEEQEEIHQGGGRSPSSDMVGGAGGEDRHFGCPAVLSGRVVLWWL